MATARQLRALIESFGSGSKEKFFSTAMQVAAYEARQGHGKIAEELRRAIDKAKQAAGRVETERGAVVRLHEPTGELGSLVWLSYPKARLTEMVLAPQMRERLSRVILEQRQQSRLREHGLEPRHKLLLVGPPGSGKTMTASALAGELGIGLFTVKLDGLITKYMGETAAKLRLVFDALTRTRGVYLFDEFDAVGGRRNATNDVGESRRILNSFLQFMDQDNSDSVIVAATNHPELLDRALFRRFDDVIEYGNPTGEQLRQTFENKIAALKPHRIDWNLVLREAEGFSYADVTRACDEAAKAFVLNRLERFDTLILLDGIRQVRERRPSA
jgi:SpoVK/Ycf46/Vps4 family AAA+-type ATPase